MTVGIQSVIVTPICLPSYRCKNSDGENSKTKEKVNKKKQNKTKPIA